MRGGFLAGAAVLVVCAALYGADVSLTEKSSVHFASVADGARALAVRDEYIKAMAPLERSARLHTGRPVSAEEFVAFCVKQVSPWKDDEIAKVTAAVQAIAPEVRKLRLELPATILFIKTTDKMEGGSPFTRDAEIVLPQRIVDKPPDDLERLVAHELFHIFTRHNPRKVDALYATIGFRRVGKIELPAQIAPRRVTNPDAPRYEHVIKVMYRREVVDAVPVIFMKHATFDPKRFGTFFEDMEETLMIVEKRDGRWQARMVDGRPLLVPYTGVRGLIEQVGLNTAYLIHPEEILADNFALLLMGKRDIPSPRVPELIRRTLLDRESNAPAAATKTESPAK